jgi:hypothetical protein
VIGLASTQAPACVFFTKIALIVQRQIFNPSSRYNRPPATLPFGHWVWAPSMASNGFEMSMNRVSSARAVCVLFESCLFTRLGDKT